MVALLIIHPLLRRLYETIRPIPAKSNSNGKANGGSAAYTSASDADNRLEKRASFDFGFAMIFIAVLHSFSAFKIMTILYMNYLIAKRLPKTYVPYATWFFNVGTLFANELAQGYKFEALASMLSPSADGLVTENWGSWMDQHGGLMPRWEILFNITVLRLISFNLDYYWSLGRRSGSPAEVSPNLATKKMPY